MRTLKSMTGFINGWIYSAANTDVLQNEEQEHAYVGAQGTAEPCMEPRPMVILYCTVWAMAIMLHADSKNS